MGASCPILKRPTRTQGRNDLKVSSKAINATSNFEVEMNISPYAGLVPTLSDLVDITALLNAFDQDQPDPKVSAQRVSFGTSGHRGTSLDRSFNRNHILAMSQAICDYRDKQKVTGPLYLGFDTHALSRPAFEAALEVFAANGMTTMIAPQKEFTPTPAISHAILTYNRNRKDALADGVVITPSHNPPQDGGFKYNPEHGGPAGKEITDVIQSRANEILEGGLSGVKRLPYDQALKLPNVHLHDFLRAYVDDLTNIIDFDVIRGSELRLAVDPLGGAGVNYWEPIAETYKLNLKVLNRKVDPTFAFMTRDWDGKIRMDPSSQYAMKSLINTAKTYDVAFACDTDHDRHGIVTKNGLIPPNHYLATMIWYLFQNRPEWSSKLKIGKTLVSSQMIDRVGAAIGRAVYEVPVGFKWFVDGLIDRQLGFAGEESAGATFLRKNGDVWTTDKDAFVPSLLSAEMTARLGKDPGDLYKNLTEKLGTSYYGRVDSPTTELEKKAVGLLSAESVPAKTLGGDAITKVATKASGNGALIGGVKIETKNGWIAARPSGTEDILKIYGESFVDQAHLNSLFSDATAIVKAASNAT
jgi:phosphoglucomutase